VEYYWPPFQSAVQRARVQSIMCSYNAVSSSSGFNVPSCANDFFNNAVVRGQWGGDLFYVSDCGAVADILNPHHYTNDPNATVAAALRGGTDVNCGSFYQQYIVQALENGSIDMADLQTAASRLLKRAFMLGLVDPPSRVVYNTYNSSMVDTAQHRQLAWEAATQSIILLKNNVTSTPWGASPLLPLQGGKLKTVAVIGPNANATQTLLSNYHGSNTVVNNQSILAALQRRGAVDGFAVNFQVRRGAVAQCRAMACSHLPPPVSRCTSRWGAHTSRAPPAPASPLRSPPHKPPTWRWWWWGCARMTARAGRPTTRCTRARVTIASTSRCQACRRRWCRRSSARANRR